MMARPAAPSRRPPGAVPAPALAPRGRVSLPDARRVHPPDAAAAAATPRKRASCACSPTTHPGSFRCALHRGQPRRALPSSSPAAAPVAPGGLLGAARRPSMASPLVRIRAVEGGDQLRRALAALVRPSPQQTASRRAAFRPRPSRLSAMSAAASPGEASS